MATINPYLHFDGTCAEAMTFYNRTFGGKLELQSVGESPMAGQMPASEHKKILHARLSSGDLLIMASDVIGPGGITKGNHVSLSVSFGSAEETERLFSQLAAGGKVLHPLKEEFFGLHGKLEDKYGLNWMFTFEKPRA
jgi:PhnB protein